MGISSTIYDYCLDKIDHYKKYPEMKPWIGKNFSNMETKILIVAESHYLPKDATYHHDADEWYKGISLTGKSIGGITTREVIKRYLNKVVRPRAYRIFINIGECLISSCLITGKKDRYTIYEDISFMNFFQRPAEKNGGSIKVHPKDVKVSTEVFQGVVECIEPSIVIFTSSKAYKYANKGGSLTFLGSKEIPYIKITHPATSWWNRILKKHSVTEKQRCINFINENC